MAHVFVKGAVVFIEGTDGRRHTPRRMDGQPDKPEFIGQRLRLLRLALGYEDQSAFAALCDVSPQAWNNWERGRQTPRLDQIAKIRRASGATVDFILFGDESGLSHKLATDIHKATAANGNQHRA